MDYRKKIMIPLLMLIFVAAFTSPCAARNAVFSWTANDEQVDGYKLYYKTGSSGPPYNGVGAIGGSSPVLTGNTITYNLQGLADSETYYFALTAFVGGLESGYTGEIVLPAIQGNDNPPIPQILSIKVKVVR
jgi:hypothetical protein